MNMIRNMAVYTIDIANYESDVRSTLGDHVAQRYSIQGINS